VGTEESSEEIVSYALSTTLHTTFEDAVERTRKALADQGFGVLTEIDTKATFSSPISGCPSAQAAKPPAAEAVRKIGEWSSP
jgi:uncharacterized protein (DUF302 family)